MNPLLSIICLALFGTIYSKNRNAKPYQQIQIKPTNLKNGVPKILDEDISLYI